MTTPEREKAENQLIADALGDILEEAEFKGLMTRQRKNRLLRRFANILNNHDLIPQKIVQRAVTVDVLDPSCEETEGTLFQKVFGKTLKERIRQRTRQQCHAPVKLPDREESQVKHNTVSSFLAARKLSHKAA